MIENTAICIYPCGTDFKEVFEKAQKDRSTPLISKIDFQSCDQTPEDIEKHLKQVVTRKIQTIILHGDMREDTLFSYLDLLYEEASGIFKEIIIFCFEGGKLLEKHIKYQYAAFFFNEAEEIIECLYKS